MSVKKQIYPYYNHNHIATKFITDAHKLKVIFAFNKNY